MFKRLFRSIETNKVIEEKRVILNFERLKTVAIVSILCNIVLTIIGFLISLCFDNIEFSENYIIAYTFSTLYNIAVIFSVKHFLNEYKKDKKYVENTSIFDLFFYSYYYISTFVGVYISLLNVKTYYQVLTVLIPIIAYSIFIVNNTKTLFYANNILFLIVVLIFYNKLPSFLGFIGTFVNFFLINTFLLIGSHFIYSNFVHAEKVQQDVEDESLTDHLTKLQNRRGMNKYFVNHFLNNHDTVNYLSVLMVDIDWFKKCNDTKGHIYGDMVLSNIGQILKNIQKNYNVDVFRYGGEEFVIFAKNLNKKVIQNLYNDFNKKLKNANILFEDGIEKRITCSVGVAYAEEKVDVTALVKYITLADEALYEAKKAGRNCVRVKIAEAID